MAANKPGVECSGWLSVIREQIRSCAANGADANLNGVSRASSLLRTEDVGAQTVKVGAALAANKPGSDRSGCPNVIREQIRSCDNMERVWHWCGHKEKLDGLIRDGDDDDDD